MTGVRQICGSGCARVSSLLLSRVENRLPTSCHIRTLEACSRDVLASTCKWQLHIVYQGQPGSCLYGFFGDRGGEGGGEESVFFLVLLYTVFGDFYVSRSFLFNLLQVRIKES